MKAAFVVQRYGTEVNGGAEYYCRTLAEHLSPQIDVSVLTTCALDYVDWRNYYAEGLADVNGIRVRRFKVQRTRNIEEFGRFSPRVYAPNHDDSDELRWMDLQGPVCPALTDYIRGNVRTYDVFVFFTYLYYTTFHGLPPAADRSVLVPTAHDEAPIRLRMYRRIFTLPKFLVFSTRAERDFVHATFDNRHVPHAIVGVGVDVPAFADSGSFRQRHGIPNRFILYAGRVDVSKGCNELFDYFLRYKANSPGDLRLVLIGKAAMPVPMHPDIIPLGFVSEEEKFAALREAEVVVVPSPYESLSIVSLEAWTLGKPILVNGGCQVLQDNCVLSNGGLYYTDYVEFEACLNHLLRNPRLRERMGNNGHAYVEANYSWDRISARYIEILERVAAQRSRL